jgi:hypothetical protein
MRGGWIVAEMYYTADSIFGVDISTRGRLYSHVEWDTRLPNAENVNGKGKNGVTAVAFEGSECIFFT